MMNLTHFLLPGGRKQFAEKLPFADLQPTVEWQVNGHCNYDCVYCIQSRASRIGVPSSETIRAIVMGFSRLPGQWEIKMSGGEPFAFRGFIQEVIPQLVDQTSHTISVLTNFSAPIDTLAKFAERTGQRLRITSASLHPDTVDFREFITKAVKYRQIRATFNPHSSFVVNVVLVPDKIDRHYEIRSALQAEGFRYFPQLMKIRGGVYPYAPRDWKKIEELAAGSHDPMTINRAPSYEGLHCEAGVWYFIVDQFGEAYTCRSGKKFGDGASLGSFVRGDFARRRAGGSCVYPICPCTVPANRGIVRLPIRSLPVAELDE